MTKGDISKSLMLNIYTDIQRELKYTRLKFRITKHLEGRRSGLKTPDTKAPGLMKIRRSRDISVFPSLKCLLCYSCCLPLCSSYAMFFYLNTFPPLHNSTVGTRCGFDGITLQGYGDIFICHWRMTTFGIKGRKKVCDGHQPSLIFKMLGEFTCSFFCH